MRLIFLVSIFASMLFSAQQRQIIIGSFSIQSNAKSYVKLAQEEFNRDVKLKQLMDKYGLKVELKKIASYNVVSICPFDGYPSLFKTMAAVKKHYPQAYSIKLRAFTPKIRTESEVVEDNSSALEEEATALDEEALLLDEEALKEDQLTTEVDAVQEAANEPIVVPEIAPVAKIPTPIPSPISQVQEADNTQELLLLLLLLLVVIAYVVYKIKTKKKVIPEE